MELCARIHILPFSRCSGPLIIAISSNMGGGARTALVFAMTVIKHCRRGGVSSF
jgi:hypothetical protein